MRDSFFQILEKQRSNSCPTPRDSKTFYSQKAQIGTQLGLGKSQVTSFFGFCLFLIQFAIVVQPVQTQSTAQIRIRGKVQDLYLYGKQGNPVVILSSGDLGWAGLVAYMADFYAAHGYYVIGFNSRVYLASFTTRTSTLTPQEVPRDFLVLIGYAKDGSVVKPILSGVSEGAGLSVLAATDPGVKAEIGGIICLGLPDQNELGWRWQDSIIWITKKAPDEPSFMVEDIIQQISPVPLVEIHSTHDEFVSLAKAKAIFGLAREPKKMWIVEAANHRFSNNRADLDRFVLEALAWIKNLNRETGS